MEELQNIYPGLLQTRTGEKNVGRVCSFLLTNGSSHSHCSLQWFFSVSAYWPLLLSQVSLGHPNFKISPVILGERKCLDNLPLYPIIYDLRGSLRVMKYKCGALMVNLGLMRVCGEGSWRFYRQINQHLFYINTRRRLLLHYFSWNLSKIIDLCVPQFPHLWNGDSKLLCEGYAI